MSDKAKKFMGLLMANQRSIQAFVTYVVPNYLDSQDIMQDTLSEMWNKFDEFQEGTNFKAWGIAIAKFKIQSHNRRFKKKKLKFSSETIKLLEIESDLLEDNDTLDMQKDFLRSCLKQLSSREKRYLSLRYERRLTFQGIAEKFGITMQAAYKAVSLIHAQLYKCLHLKMREENLL